MIRVEIKQQSVVYRELCGCEGTLDRQAKHRIVTIDVLIDQEPSGRERAVLTISPCNGLDAQARERVSARLRRARP